MAHPLDGAQAKRDRAFEHAQALRNKLAGVDPQDFYGSRAEERDKGRRTTVTGFLVVKKEPPTEWGILAGDFAQNARAALDHTIYQVALLSTKRPKPVFFPIAVTPDEYLSLKPCDMPSLRDQALAGIPETHRALVDELQPHAGGKSRALAEGDPLAVLNAFSNADKHRVIHAALVRPERVGALVEVGDPTLTLTVPPKSLRLKVLADGAHVYTLVIKRPTDTQVRVKVSMSYAIGFGPRGVSDADMLNLADYIGVVIARFRERLFS